MKKCSITLLLFILCGCIFSSQVAHAEWSGNYYYQHGAKLKSKWFFDKSYGKWFYLKEDGVYARNEWIGSYYLTSNGAMAENQWIFDKKYDSWFYLKEDGTYAHHQWIGSYYLKSGGYMAKQEWIFDKNYSNWFYLKKDGVYARNTWIQDYYVIGNGEMAKKKWVHFTREQLPRYISDERHATGWYYFGQKGSLLKNKWIGKYFVDQSGRWDEQKDFSLAYSDALKLREFYYSIQLSLANGTGTTFRTLVEKLGEPTFHTDEYARWDGVAGSEDNSLIVYFKGERAHSKNYILHSQARERFDKKQLIKKADFDQILINNQMKFYHLVEKFGTPDGEFETFGADRLLYWANVEESIGHNIGITLRDDTVVKKEVDVFKKPGTEKTENQDATKEDPLHIQKSIEESDPETKDEKTN